MKQIIINGKIILENEIISGNLLINDGYIEGITNEVIDGYEVIDAKNYYVSPGFIDVHTHGRAGFDTMNGTNEAIEALSLANLETGVTSFLATTMTQSFESTKQAIEVAANYKGNEKGAKIAGIHMEGPFINTEYKGAQSSQYIVPPTLEVFNAMVKEHRSLVKLITIAPEIDGAYNFIEQMKEYNITVSIGHTAATYDQVKEAISHGLHHATHTFNAMTPFNHRAPGVVGAVFDSDKIYAELILDGLHVHFASANILIKQKGVDKVVLITDSMEAAGLAAGLYQLGGQPVYVKNKEARLKDGTLAGSVLNMNKAVYNAYKLLGLPLYDAVKMASITAAKSVNLDNVGILQDRYSADIIMFDEDITIKFVMVDGQIRKQLGE